MQVAGYAGLLLATPTVLYEIVAYVVPGLTKSEKDLLAPIVFGSSILFYIGWEPSSDKGKTGMHARTRQTCPMSMAQHFCLLLAACDACAACNAGCYSHTRS